MLPCCSGSVKPRHQLVILRLTVIVGIIANQTSRLASVWDRRRRPFPPVRPSRAGAVSDAQTLLGMGRWQAILRAGQPPDRGLRLVARLRYGA
jgi:hypothetical protein